MASTLMFHSVGLRRHAWRSPQIAEDTHYFRAKVAALSRAGYRSVFFTDPALRAPMNADDRVICLSFDDGYLDNWVHVLPVLQEFGFRATIFVTPEFVDPRPIVRDQAPAHHRDDARHDPASCCAGFLSWEEMRAMESSGLVEIQSHALTHDFYFSGPTIVDYWRPGAATRPGGPAWLLWLEDRSAKPFYLTRAEQMESSIPWGTPIYEHRKSLEGQQWFPDEPALGPELCAHVESNGGPAFFDRDGWREELDALAARHRGAGERGRFESRQDYLQRVRHELSRSKELLEEGLGHEVIALVWPGGGVSEDALAIARDVGYRVFSRPAGVEPLREPDAWTVERVGSICRERWKGEDLGNLTGMEFLWRLRAAEGGRLESWLSRSSRGVRYLASKAGLVGA